jgi:hypothetical protein
VAETNLVTGVGEPRVSSIKLKLFQGINHLRSYAKGYSDIVKFEKIIIVLVFFGLLLWIAVLDYTCIHINLSSKRH